MKALIIILVLVGVSFIGLLVYGEAQGEQQPSKACERMPASFNSKDGPSEDDLSNWCPPSYAEKTRSLQARFAPGLKLKQPATLQSSSSALFPATFGVPSSSSKMRAAHIELVDGTAAILTDGPQKSKLCLCKPHVQISQSLFDSNLCPGNWKDAHRPNAVGHQKGACQDGDVRGIIPIDDKGGSIVLQSQPPATVKIQ